MGKVLKKWFLVSFFHETHLHEDRLKNLILLGATHRCQRFHSIRLFSGSKGVKQLHALSKCKRCLFSNLWRLLNIGLHGKITT